MAYSKEEIQKYIEYAKGRGVSVSLTNPDKQLYADIAMAMLVFNQVYEEKEKVSFRIQEQLKMDAEQEKYFKEKGKENKSIDDGIFVPSEENLNE